MKNKSGILKGLIITMGLLTAICGLFGCSKPADLGNEEEFGLVGEDYSKEGPGEYKKVTELFYRVGGYGPNYSYSIHKSEEDENITVFEGEDYEYAIQDFSGEIDDEVLLQISQLCADMNVISWDKFDMSDRGVLDGEGFDLTVVYEDGTRIKAGGDNAFPKNYQGFQKGISDIMKPCVENAMSIEREKKYDEGLYSSGLDYVMICFSQRGASGDDSYDFSISGESNEGKRNVRLDIKSVSGEFIEAGDYSFNEYIDDADEMLSKIQEVLEKYQVYKWDGYDKSTDDYNDREWFQLNFVYPEAAINCYGCGDTENYEQVRKELLEIIVECMKKYI